MVEPNTRRSKLYLRHCAIVTAAGIAVMLGASAAIAHSVFLEATVPLTGEIELVEFDAHLEDELGNSVPIDISVPLGGSAKIIIRDNIGCKATVGVASASTFVNVEPTTSTGPVVEQEFVVSGNEGADGQGRLPLVIGWTGDGETIAVGDGEVVCDESHQAVFRVSFGPIPEEEEEKNEEPPPPEMPGTPRIPCGPGVIGPMLFAYCALSLVRRRRR